MTAEFPDKLTAVITLRVPFHDVDSARVVWHGHYFKYFIHRKLIPKICCI